MSIPLYLQFILGERGRFTYTLTNVGLIRAESVSLRLPDDHPILEFHTDFGVGGGDIGALEAQGRDKPSMQIRR